MKLVDIYIKYVALYLRKSRGDNDEDLIKHKTSLIDLCKKNKWKYIIYSELESGDSIFMRPVFQKLLSDVRDGVYDAVAVVDIDRLGRGDMGDQDAIKKTFAKSQTYVVTPEKIYDLNNDDDEFVIEMKGFIARQEYKQITRRFSRGKKVGSRLGFWTNGKPPYPYEYERYKLKYNPKGLVVNDEKLKVYKYMVNSMVDDDMTPNGIAIALNKKGIPSPRGGIWHGVTVGRILADETHLGKIISNKSKGDGHKKKKPNAKDVTLTPKTEWVVVENCHEKTKTQEDHEKILLFMSRLGRKPKRKTAETYPLSGLIKCGLCGRTSTIYYRPERKNKESIKACWYKDAVGNKCNNRGIETKYLYIIINEKIAQYEYELKQKIDNIDVVNKRDQYEKALSTLNDDKAKKQQSLIRIKDAYDGGVYELQEFKERKVKVEKDINNINEKIEIINIKIKDYKEDSIINKIDNVEKFQEEIQKPNITNTQKNELYKSIINCITWTRVGEDISIDIQFK